MHAAAIAFGAMLAIGAAPTAAQQPVGDVVTIPGCLVTLIDEVEVPAEEAGKLQEIMVKEGDQVETGAVLAQIDDRKAVSIEEVARFQLDVAKVEAENDVNVRYANAAWKVALAEHDGALEANRITPGTFPRSEILKLRLQVEQFALQIQQSQRDMEIAGKRLSVRTAELNAATVDVARRKITAVWPGVIVERYRHAGEWVQPGEPVMKMVRMDRLRVRGLLDGTRYVRENVDKQPVLVTVPLPNGQVQVEGTVTFASPIVGEGSLVQVMAEVDNQRGSDGQWILNPGRSAEMSIRIRR